MTESDQLSPLTADSPQIACDPPQTRFRLWDHQRAMVQRALHIETLPPLSSDSLEINPCSLARFTPKGRLELQEHQVQAARSVKLGIFNDPPGCGKTHAMLSVLALDSSPTLNLVVVPENLLGQWAAAIDAFFEPGCFPYRVLRTMEEVNDLDLDVDVAPRVLVVPCLLLDRVSSVLPAGVEVARVILDEIDITAHTVEDIAVGRIIWFLSASLDLHDPRNCRLGPFAFRETVTAEDILRRTCCCQKDFMLLSQGRLQEQVSIETVEVPAGDLALFDGILEPRVMRWFHALDFHRVRNRVLDKFRRYVPEGDYRTLAELLLQEYRFQCEWLEETMGQLGRRDEQGKIIHAYREQLAEYRRRIECLTERLSVKPEVAAVAPPTKWTQLCGLVERFHEDPTSKWLIFSDTDATLDRIYDLLVREKQVDAVTLGEGSTPKHAENLRRFKEDPDCRALLLNSIRDGCGLNLENTTHVLFLHATNPALVDQVLGRALRPGRTRPLTVLHLHHTGEVQNERMLESAWDQDTKKIRYV